MVREIPVYHIQHDFTDCIKDVQEGKLEEDSFYINKDLTLDKIKEYRVNIRSQDDSEYDAGQGNTFQKVTPDRYRAILDGDLCSFQACSSDYSAETEDTEWTAVDAIDTPTSQYVLGDSNGNIHLYYELFNPLYKIEEAHFGDITSVKFFPSGKLILSASTDMRMKIWSLEDRFNPRTFVGHQGPITDTAIIDRGRNVLSSSKDGKLKLWECGSGKAVATMFRKENPNDAINSMSLLVDNSPGREQNNGPLEFGTLGKRALAGHSSGVVTMHDIFSKDEQLQLPNEFMCACNAVAASEGKQNSIYAGYQDGTVAEWDLRFPAKSVSSISFNKGTPINTLCATDRFLYISSEPDTSIKLDISGENGSSTSQEPATFLVSNDNKVSQFIQAPRKDSVVSVGNRGFIAAYKVYYNS
ncbi:Rpn14p KNAG_0D03460 [Huiozyma naganishii CBS 8797]|uniref:Uncharacterized protein n=1 Tax=Huiozyma naganishii (strain ATCC MYA-139 / BCRC 22969 / CBS 8797 / KCTC 17520 / NBRC 10181 / NCYC 3082 / Yp74L-3) TaxID=1071383 RepID=J7RKR4_HUIN7|nr:hypothetical protein KNAG_0D03460 [Kazachstania naganishii CBS 8797]CCK70093.1 hypothetical protein KNAG_0D03460 [Kazachstania naganishii CBS 8797]